MYFLSSDSPPGGDPLGLDPDVGGSSPPSSSLSPSSSSPPSSPSAKLQRTNSHPVYIICSETRGSCDHLVYNIDMADIAAADDDSTASLDRLISLHPFLRLKGFESHAFCLLNSTLYIFSGYSNGDKRFDADFKKRCHKLDLSRLTNLLRSEFVLEKSKIDEYADKLPDMLRSKCDPIAVATPDGKQILIFSSRAQRDPRANGCWMHYFELFDLESYSWKTLRKMGGNLYNFVAAYGFLNNSVFIASLGYGKPFYQLAINEENQGSGWMHELNIANMSYYRGPFWGIDKGLFITNKSIGSWMEDDPSSCITVSIPVPDFDAAVGKVVGEVCETICLLSHVREKLEECTFCTFKLGTLRKGGSSKHPLAISVCKFNIAKYKSEMAEYIVEMYNDHLLHYEPPTVPTIHKNLKYALIGEPNGTLEIETCG